MKLKIERSKLRIEFSDSQFLIFFQFVDFASFFLRRASGSSVAVFDFICVDEFYSLVFFFRRQVSINIFDLFWRDSDCNGNSKRRLHLCQLDRRRRGSHGRNRIHLCYNGRQKFRCQLHRNLRRYLVN